MRTASQETVALLCSYKHRDRCTSDRHFFVSKHRIKVRCLRHSAECQNLQYAVLVFKYRMRPAIDEVHGPCQALGSTILRNMEGKSPPALGPLSCISKFAALVFSCRHRHYLADGIKSHAYLFDGTLLSLILSDSSPTSRHHIHDT